MSNKYRDANEKIDDRFKRAEKCQNTTEMYAAKDEYDKNIEKQKEQLSEMDKRSPEYQKMSDDIREQEFRSASMGTKARESLGHESRTDKLDDLKKENEALANKMHSAVEKGDTKAYDAARQQYETNIKAQDSMSKQMKVDGIEHENTTTRQNIHKQQLDEDMYDKVNEKMQEKAAKGKQPSEKERAEHQKYASQASKSREENLKRYDDRKLDEMKNYGLSEEEIAKERKQMEHERERYR